MVLIFELFCLDMWDPDGSQFKEWKVGEFSTVTVDIEEKGTGTCDVTLTQAGIPREDAHGHGDWAARCESGWRERILGGMKRFLGYGMDFTD